MPDLTPFGHEVHAALATARAEMLSGPRTVTELARTVGLAESTLRAELTGRRKMIAYVEDAIRAALGMPRRKT